MSAGQVGDIQKEAIRNFLSPILHLLEDEKVTEIMINSPKEIWFEVGG